MKPIITLSNGTELDKDLELAAPKILGYQIINKQTERILPGTTRNEIYIKAAGIRKMNQISTMFNIMQASIEIWDYRLVPVYEFEGLPQDYKLIRDADDDIFY